MFHISPSGSATTYIAFYWESNTGTLSDFEQLKETSLTFGGYIALVTELIHI